LSYISEIKQQTKQKHKSDRDCGPSQPKVITDINSQPGRLDVRVDALAQQINHISIAPLAQAPADPATTPHLSAEQYVVTTLPQKLPPAQQADLDALPAENKALRAKIEQLEQSNKALAANVNTLAGWH
jgi:hypothetical protein